MATIGKICFWQARSGLEIDFIIYGPKFFYAIEVKNSKTINPHDLRSLKEFMKDYPEITPILLYRGNEKIKKEGILCFPVQTFLQKLDPDLNISKTLE